MQLTEQLAMVVLVFTLLGALLWFFKRRGLASFPLGSRKSGSGPRLEVLERVPLTPQHALHLVRVSDRTVLIATAPSSCTLLEAAIPVDAAAALSRNLLRSTQ
jgi:flagellar biogenesis protein FliO